MTDWEGVHLNVEESRPEIINIAKISCRGNKLPSFDTITNKAKPVMMDLMQVMSSGEGPNSDDDPPEGMNRFVCFGATADFCMRFGKISGLNSDKFGNFSRIAGHILWPRYFAVEITNIPQDKYVQKELNPYEALWIKEGEKTFCPKKDAIHPDRFTLWNLEKEGCGSYGLTPSNSCPNRTNSLWLYMVAFYALAPLDLPWTALLRNGESIKLSHRLTAYAIGCDNGKHPRVVIKCPKKHLRTYYKERMKEKEDGDWHFDDEKHGPAADDGNDVFSNTLRCHECDETYGIEEWTCCQVCDWKCDESESEDDDSAAQAATNLREVPLSLPGALPPIGWQ